MPSRPEGVQSVARALDVLDALRSASPLGLRVTDLADTLGVDAATVTRLLQTFVSRGYASQLASRRYTLGPAVARLPRHWLDRALTAIGPLLGELAQETGETIFLLEQLGGEAVTIATMRPAMRPALECEVGPTFPLWATAAGHALLAPLSSTERLRLLPPEPYPAFTPATPRSWAELTAAIARGTERGLFTERACFARGVECIAAGVTLETGPPGETPTTLAIAASYPSRPPARWRSRQGHGQGPGQGAGPRPVDATRLSQELRRTAARIGTEILPRIARAIRL